MPAANKNTVHAVLGDGEAPAKVITEGLRDVVKAGDTIALAWIPKPSQTYETVYDYIIDNDVPFILFYKEGETPPGVFRKSEHGVVQKVRNSLTAALKAVEGKGKVLFLWDQEADDDQISFVADNVSEGVLVLELTNGLAPVSFHDDIPEPTDPEIEEDETVTVPTRTSDDDDAFTKDELETMTAVAVKRYGARVGTVAATKSGIIGELFPDEAQTKVKEKEDEPYDANAGSAPVVDSQVASILRHLAGDLIKLANVLTEGPTA